MSDERLRLLERRAWQERSPEAWGEWARESARTQPEGPQSGPLSVGDYVKRSAALSLLREIALDPVEPADTRRLAAKFLMGFVPA